MGYEFPKMVFKKHDEKVVAQDSGPLDNKTVHSQEELDKAKADGWKESPADFGIETAPGDPSNAPAAKDAKGGSHDAEAKKKQAEKDEAAKKQAEKDEAEAEARYQAEQKHKQKTGY